MRSIKRLAALLLTMVMLALSGCTAARQSRPYSVYLISKSASTEFWKSVFAGANAAKSEYNVDLTILAPETEEEYEVQNDYVRQAIESRADAIVFSAISYTGNAEAINEAVAAGIRSAAPQRAQNRAPALKFTWSFHALEPQAQEIPPRCAISRISDRTSCIITSSINVPSAPAAASSLSTASSSRFIAAKTGPSSPT